MSENRIFKKIDHRTWENIRTEWFAYLPVIDPPGSAPQMEVAHMEGLVEIQKRANQDSRKIYRENVSSIRSDIFREGIFLMHKANNVCCAAIHQIENGILTWSISDAYHASFFALKGLLSLLGISVPQVGRHHLIVDCFPVPDVLSSKLRKRGVQPEPTMQFFALGMQLTHLDFWSLFQHILRISKIEVWDTEIVNFLKNIDNAHFSKQRNSIHYKNAYWTFPEDLFQRHFDEDFGLNENIVSDLQNDQTIHDFPLLLSYLLIKLSFDLLEDLAQNSTIVAQELALMKKMFAESNNHRLIKSVNLTI